MASFPRYYGTNQLGFDAVQLRYGRTLAAITHALMSTLPTTLDSTRVPSGVLE